MPGDDNTDDPLLRSLRDHLSSIPKPAAPAPLVLGPADRVVDADALRAALTDPSEIPSDPVSDVPPAPHFDVESLRDMFREIVREEIAAWADRNPLPGPGAGPPDSESGD